MRTRFLCVAMVVAILFLVVWAVLFLRVLSMPPEISCRHISPDAGPGWRVQPGSQSLFLSCPIWEVLYEGTRGCQKTDSLIMDYCQHVGQGFDAHWRGILFRQTFKQLDDIVARTRRWFRVLFPRAVYNGSTYTWTWPDGEQLLLRYMRTVSDYDQYHGWEVPWVGWEELTNWPYPDCYEKMKGCSRSSHPGVPRKYRSNCNPWGVGHHWVKEHFIDPAPPLTIIKDENGRQRVRIHGDLRENLILLQADPEYMATLKSLKDENLKKAWLYGRWDIVAGGCITDVWNPDVHVIPPFRIPQTWYVDRSFDWGSSAPFSVGWWAESDGTQVYTKTADGRLLPRTFPRGTLFRIAEFYGWSGKANHGCKMHSSDIARNIAETERRFDLVVRPGPADPQIWEIRDGDTIAARMERMGVRWEKAPKGPGSRVMGLDVVRERLKNSLDHPMERPGMFIFNTCRHWLRTVPVLPRDEKKMDEPDTDAEDHCYDETAYRLMYDRPSVTSQEI